MLALVDLPTLRVDQIGGQEALGIGDSLAFFPVGVALNVIVGVDIFHDDIRQRLACFRVHGPEQRFVFRNLAQQGGLADED